jgi:hypothetical protein
VDHGEKGSLNYGNSVWPVQLVHVNNGVVRFRLTDSQIHSFRLAICLGGGIVRRSGLVRRSVAYKLFGIYIANLYIDQNNSIISITTFIYSHLCPSPPHLVGITICKPCPGVALVAGTFQRSALSLSKQLFPCTLCSGRLRRLQIGCSELQELCWLLRAAPAPVLVFI